jgi:P-type Ca2+ transporter type 2C
MEILIIIFLGLFGSFLLGEFFKKFNLPRIIAPLIIGILFALSPFSNLFQSNLDLNFFDIIKDIALVFLLFYVGLKINLKSFNSLSKKSLYVGIFASFIPLIIGFLLTIIMFSFFNFQFIDNDSNIFVIALLIGIIFSVTAESVIIEILEELGLIDSVVGQTILEAGIIDDVLSIFLITIISTLFSNSSTSINLGLSLLFKLGQVILFSIILFFLSISVLPKILKFLEKNKSSTSIFSLALIISFFLAAVTQFFELGGSVLGAILGGIIVNYALLKGDKFMKHQQKIITDIIEMVTFGFFAPFFYIWIGFNVNITIFFKYPFHIFILFLLLTFSKLFGSMVGNKLSGGKLKEGFIMGLAMNTKGGVDVMILSLALISGVINHDLFSLIICVSFLATIISPILFEKLVKKHHGL